MSSLRGRTRNSSWQWFVIGMVLGLGCSSVFCLAGYATNYIRFNLPGQTPDSVAAGPTLGVTVLVVTPTPQPVTSTPVDITPAAATAMATGVVLAPTITHIVITGLPTVPQPTIPGAPAATFDGTVIPSPVPATAAPVQTEAAVGPGTAATEAAVAGGASAPLQPSITASDLVQVTGGIFEMGTTLTEVKQAVDDCLSRDKGKCDQTMAEDAFPAHNVTVNAFRMEKTEVSVEQYIAFLNYLGPNSHKNQCEGQPCAAVVDKDYPYSNIKFDGTTYQVTNEIFRRRPITYVTWYGADTYCKTIGRRLPTEAEWERAARDPDKRIYPWGDVWDATKARTNRPKNENGPDDVDSYKLGLSGDGIYNLAGNVSEWVYDWYDSAYYKTLASSPPTASLDPKGPANGQTKVIRGGDWDGPPFFARTVHRRDVDPTSVTGTIGFRCVADADLTKPSPTKAPAGGAAATAAKVPGKATATFTQGPLASGSGGK